jgi:hypothetical protein
MYSEYTLLLNLITVLVFRMIGIHSLLDLILLQGTTAAPYLDSPLGRDGGRVRSEAVRYVQ